MTLRFPHRARLAGCAALALALGACGSTQASRFYALVPLAAHDAPEGAAPAGALTPGGSLVGLEAVRIPEELVDRPQFVMSVSTHERRFDEYARWAEPLAAHITAVLAENLSALLAPTPVMVAPDRERRTPAVLVRVDELLHFDARAGGDALLTARWSLASPDAEAPPLAEGTGSWRTPAGDGDPEALAAAMSRNVLELSRSIAAGIGAHAPR